MNTKYLFGFFIIIFILLAVRFTLFDDSQITYGYNQDLTVYEKIEKGIPLSYLVIGDSIGRGSGAETDQDKWFKKLERKLESRLDVKMKGQYIVQSGATAFEGMIKFTKNKFYHGTDLVFIVFGENDRKYMNSDNFSALYEALLRKVKTAYPTAEIITLTESCLQQEDFAGAISVISEHYLASNVDMRPVFEASGFETAELTTDSVHPNAKGYELYAEAVYKQIVMNISEQKEIANLKPALFPETDLNYREQSEVMEQKGFSLSRGNYISNEKGSYIEYEFSGSSLGIRTIRSPDGGLADVFIDGEYVTSLNMWWPFERERFIYIKNDLTKGDHTVRFQLNGNSAAANVTGETYLRISSIIIEKE